MNLFFLCDLWQCSIAFFTSAIILREPVFSTLADAPNASTKTAFNMWGKHQKCLTTSLNTVYQIHYLKHFQKALIYLTQTILNLALPNLSTRANKWEMSSMLRSRSQEERKNFIASNSVWSVKVGLNLYTRGIKISNHIVTRISKTKTTHLRIFQMISRKVCKSTFKLARGTGAFLISLKRSLSRNWGSPCFGCWSCSPLSQTWCPPLLHIDKDAHGLAVRDKMKKLNRS